MTTLELHKTADIRVRSVSVIGSDDELTVGLMDGRKISAPLAWYPRLARATPAQRSHWQVSGGGFGIHWPDVDEDLSTEGLLAGAPAPGVRHSGPGLARGPGRHLATQGLSKPATPVTLPGSKTPPSPASAGIGSRKARRRARHERAGPFRPRLRRLHAAARRHRRQQPEALPGRRLAPVFRAPAPGRPGALDAGRHVRLVLVGDQIQGHHAGRDQPPGLLVRREARRHHHHRPADGISAAPASSRWTRRGTTTSARWSARSSRRPTCRTWSR